MVFIAFMVLVLPGALVAQQLPGAPAPKDPQLAKTYALYFSGLGHLYSGETVKGSAMLGVTLVGLYQVAGELGCSAASNPYIGIETDCNDTKLLLWLGATVGSYVYSLIDADDAARRTNARLRGPGGVEGYFAIGEPGRIKLGLRKAL